MNQLNVNMPKTFFAHKPEDLMSGTGPVRACPFYQVPASPSSTQAAESEYAYSAFILDTLGDDMVRVRFEHSTTPGDELQGFYPHELHLGSCMCRACKGDSIVLYANISV